MPYHQPEKIGIPPIRFYGGLFLGLAFGLVFYQFGILLAELLRFMAMDHYFQFWPLTSEERLYFKLFFAALGFIGGLGVIFDLWFYRARTYGSKVPSFRSRVYNDHTVLQWSFLHWFIKLGFLYITFLGWTFFSPKDSLNFYENYFWLFPGILLALFLNMWKSLLLKYRGTAFRYMGLSALLIAALSGLASQWDWVNAEAIEAEIAKNNPYKRFDVQIPITSYGERDSSFRVFYQEYFLVPSDSSSFEIYKSLNKCVVSQAEFLIGLHDAYFYRAHFIPPYRRLRWVIDKDLIMESVIKAHFLLPDYIYARGINYAVQPKANTRALDYFNFQVYYYGSGLDAELNIPLPPPSPFVAKLYEYELRLEPGVKNRIIVDGREIGIKELEALILQRLKNKEPLGFHFSGWQQKRFGNYFKVLETIRRVLDNSSQLGLRKENTSINIRFDDQVTKSMSFKPINR